MNAVLTELNKLGKASAESISKGLNIDLNDVIDTLWKLKNQGGSNCKKWHLAGSCKGSGQKTKYRPSAASAAQHYR